MLTKQDKQNVDGLGKTFIRHARIFVGKDSKRYIKEYIKKFTEETSEEHVSTFYKELNGYYIHPKSKQWYFNIRLGIESKPAQLELIF